MEELQRRVEDQEAELARYKKSLTASVKAVKKLQKEKEDLEKALSEDDSVIRANQLRQEREAELTQYRSQIHAIQELAETWKSQEGTLLFSQASSRLLDQLNSTTVKPTNGVLSTTESSHIISDLSERLRVAASQKVLLETRLSQKTSEAEDLRHKLETLKSHNESTPSTPVKDRNDSLDVERSKLLAELQQEKQRNSLLLSEIEVLRRQSGGMAATLERMEKLQRDLEQARKDFEAEEGLRLEERTRLEEKINELSAVVGAHEQRLEQERQSKAAMKHLQSPNDSNLDTSIPANPMAEVLRLRQENKVLDEKVKKLKGWINANRKPSQESILELSKKLQPEKPSTTSPNASPAKQTEANDVIVDSLRRQLHTVTSQFEKARKQLAENEQEINQLKSTTASLNEQLTIIQSAHHDEVAQLKNDWTSRYEVLNQQFKLLRQRTDEQLQQKDVEIGKLNAQLHGGGPVHKFPSELTSEQMIFSPMLTATSRPPMIPSTSLSFADVFARDNEQLLEASQLPSLEQELAMMSSQLKLLQQNISEFERKEASWKNQEKIFREEIARLERMQRRETHNLEYVKNVVMQFVLSPPQTRKQLTVVLGRVLELTQEELSKLNTFRS